MDGFAPSLAASTAAMSRSESSGTITSRRAVSEISVERLRRWPWGTPGGRGLVMVGGDVGSVIDLFGAVELSGAVLVVWSNTQEQLGNAHAHAHV